MTLHSSAYRHLVNSVFVLPFQFSNLHVFIFLYTIPPSVFGRPLVDFPGDYYWLLDLNFLLLSILVTWPIQFNGLTLTNEIITKSPNSCDNSLLYRFLQISFILNSPNILLKTFLSKAASPLAISVFDTQHSAPQVTNYYYFNLYFGAIKF